MRRQLGSFQIIGSSPSLAYRLEDIRGVAADLRAERAPGRRTARRDLTPIRLALGGAFLELGAALVGGPVSIGAAR